MDPENTPPESAFHPFPAVVLLVVFTLVIEILVRLVGAFMGNGNFSKVLQDSTAGRLCLLLFFFGLILYVLAKKGFAEFRKKYSFTIVSTYHVAIDPHVVNPKNIILNCPNIVRVERRNDSTLKICLDDSVEMIYTLKFRTVRIAIGQRTGRIKSVVVSYRQIRERGMWLRVGCTATAWREYIGSVVTAHIEVAKFSMERRNRQSILVSRIFKHYSDPIFQEVA